MNHPTCLLLAALFALVVGHALGAEVSGQWRGEFDSPIGQQKYLFTFTTDSGKVIGKATAELDGRKRDVEFKDMKLEGDTLTFVETFKFQDNEMQIDYTGRVSGDGIKFTRKVGDFGTEEFVAHRVEAAAAAASSTNATTNNPERRRRGGGFGGPIVLGPDDKPAFADPPAGFDVKKDQIPHGSLEMAQYDSKTVGTARKMQVYTPPGYSKAEKYPVLYLLHGIGGDETEWERLCHPDIILDNLLAEQKIVPMIVVMPNGRAQKNDRAEGDVFSSAPAFANFERDLLDDVIPAIEARYSVQADREHRALAGLSMGGGQSLNFGLAHLDTFAWVGGFSSAPNTKSPEELLPDPAAAGQQLKLLWLGCGNKDGLIRISQGVHAFLKSKNMTHVWHVDGNAHDPTEWKNNLYLFAQHIFRAGSVVRIKAGLSTAFTDSSGKVWQADNGFDGGDVIERDANTAIANTKDPQLYLTEHYGMSSFSCGVPNGKYLAKLYFAETFEGVTGPGERVFSFDVQGHAFKDFDVWVKAGGPNKAYVETVPVDVTDGKFKIVFTSNIQNPEINAIELIPQT